MGLRKLVKSLRNPVNMFYECRKETDTLKKCIMCKKYLSSNKWGKLLESHVIKKFKLASATDNTSGDAVSKRGNNIEIKVSLGTANGGFNFVQLRPSYNINYYILLTYNMFHGDLGEVKWFVCKAEELYKLLPAYGGYAHGSVDSLGKITHESIKNNKGAEYALRPNCRIKGKQRELWNIMCDKFETREEDVKGML